MKNHANRRSVNSKAFAAVLALVLVLGCALGGTVAWLVAESGPVINTFTYGDINIALTETTGGDYKIIPGVNIAKDPKVTVEADSEACWLFVKVDEDGTFVAGKVTYSVANGWTKGDGTKIPTNVYYREVSAAEAKDGASYYVLAGDTDHSNGVVKVSDKLTKENIKDITTKPTLTFTAYAVQKDGIADAATAWSKIG